jgi:hypothetical protein
MVLGGQNTSINNNIYRHNLTDAGLDTDCLATSLKGFSVQGTTLGGCAL